MQKTMKINENYMFWKIGKNGCKYGKKIVGNYKLMGLGSLLLKAGRVCICLHTSPFKVHACACPNSYSRFEDWRNFSWDVSFVCLPYARSAAQGGGGSFKDRKPIGEAWLWCMGGRAHPLMDGKVVGDVFFGGVAPATSPTTAGCSVV